VGKAILIVEDSADDAELFKRLLIRTGVLNPIRVMHNAADAMAYLDGKGKHANRQHSPVPSVVILDLKLPDIDGFEVLEWCKAHDHCKDALIVILSGHGDIASIRRAYKLGADSFLTKPCRPADLENLIHGYPQYWLRE
jgi:CheY-like chemotaxis protein